MNKRIITAPTGGKLSCKNWQIEAPFRMIQNNLDPSVAENPDELIVYGGKGKAARDWESFESILITLKRLNPDETLLIQSGKPIGVLRTHIQSPRVLIANSNLQDVIERHRPHLPAARLGQPEEIAKTALFLASDDSSFMSGNDCFVDGAYNAI